MHIMYYPMFSFQNMLKCITCKNTHPSQIISYDFIFFSTPRGCFNLTGITEFSISWFGGCRALHAPLLFLHPSCQSIHSVLLNHAIDSSTTRTGKYNNNKATSV